MDPVATVSEATEALYHKRKLLLELKLGAILHSYHMGQTCHAEVDPTVGFMDFVKHYAASYAVEYENAKDQIMEVCNNLCGTKCLTDKFNIKNLRENHDLFQQCPFDLNLLHAILEDGYPVESHVYNIFKNITGHELSTGGK